MRKTFSVLFILMLITAAYASTQAGDIGTAVSLDYQDAEVLTIYGYLAEVRGYNLVIHPGVSGRITLRFVNVPWERAMNAVLKTMGHEMRIGDNIIEVGLAGFFLER